MNVVNKLQQQRYTILNKQYNKIEERIENSNRIMSEARRNDFLKNFISKFSQDTTDVFCSRL